MDQKLIKYVDSIAATALFRNIDHAEIALVLADSPYSVMEYKKGSILHLSGDVCTTLELILQGVVSLQSVDSAGNALGIQQLSPGEIIGAGILFAKDNQYPMMSSTESDAMILRLSKDSILSLCRLSTEFTLNMLQEVAKRTAALAEQLHSIAYQSIRHRLCELLLREFRLQQSRVIILPASQKQIAEHFGVQRQSLSRELNRMRQDGLLEYKHRTIELHDSFFEE